MKYIFDQNLDKVLRPGGRLFLFLDYDGTLTPIVKDPASAFLDPAVKKLLRQLSGKKNLVLGIISGRSLTDIKKRVGINNIFYAGNHGLEFLFRGRKTFIQESLLKQCLPTLNLAKEELKKALAGIKGVVFEDKGAIFAVHYRKVKKDLSRIKLIFKRTISPYLRGKKLKITAGKKVLEIRPNIPVNKFDAVNFLQNRLKKRKNEITIFIGDDLTDEDIFKKLAKSDLGIRVGRKQDSFAKYFLKTPKEVNKLLIRILNSKSPC